jgi:hypothetical protein
MRNWLRWVKGRQDGENVSYWKMLLAASERLKFDLYLLKFDEGSEVPWHNDYVAFGWRHHRINIVLWKPRKGGRVVVMGPTKRWGRDWQNRCRAMYFRPDRDMHMMKTIVEGSMLMLSFGWLRKTDHL